jgi:hypothetical protein
MPLSPVKAAKKGASEQKVPQPLVAMKKCPFCEEEIPENATFCQYCSFSLPPVNVAKQDTSEQKVPRQEVSKITEEPPLKLSMQQSAVSTPRIEETKVGAETLSRPSPPQGASGTPHIKETKVKAETLYKAVIGGIKPYYLQKFAEFDKQPPGLKVSWNWAAFFGNYFWALYRKMYGWFLACFGIYVLAAICLYYLKYFKSDAPEIYSILDYVFMIAFGIVFGIIANSLYYRSVKKKIAAAQSLITDRPKILEFLRDKGGVHTWVIWVCICLAALILLLFAGTFVSGIISQKANYGDLFIYAAMGMVNIAIIFILYSFTNIEWEVKLQGIWDDYQGYIIISISIIIILIGILFTILNQNKREQPISVAVPKVEAPVVQPAPAPAPVPSQPTGPTQEDLERLAREKYLNAIRSAHPDFDNLRDSGKIVAWIQKQPRRLRDSLLKTYNEGDADSVIALLDQFKKDKNNTRLRKEKAKIPIRKDKVKITEKDISVTKRPVDSEKHYKAIGGGLKGIKLNDGDVIEGQIISFSGDTVKIRTKDGKILTYSFIKDIQMFIY